MGARARASKLRSPKTATSARPQRRSAMHKLVAALLCSCALSCAQLPARTSLGDITVRSVTAPLMPPTTIGVQTGRLVTGDFDFALDPDGCVRGLVQGRMIMLCPKAPVQAALSASKPGARVEKWVGTGGDLTLEVAKDQKSVHANGFVRGPAGSLGTLQVQLTLPFAPGPQWDELRAHPVLYVVVAAVSGISGEGSVEVR